MHIFLMLHTRLLVDLDGGLVGFDSNDLSGEVVMTDADLKLLTMCDGWVYVLDIPVRTWNIRSCSRL